MVLFREMLSEVDKKGNQYPIKWTRKQVMSSAAPRTFVFLGVTKDEDNNDEVWLT
jgi:hypothetical protein